MIQDRNNAITDYNISRGLRAVFVVTILVSKGRAMLYRLASRGHTKRM